MRKFFACAGTAVVAIVGAVVLAPGAWAMLPPEPYGSSTPVPSAPPAYGIGVWQVVAIAVLAVLIGAVGSIFAQRVRREPRHRSTVMA